MGLTPTRPIKLQFLSASDYSTNFLDGRAGGYILAGFAGDHPSDLRVAIHGSSDQVTVQNWYAGTANRIEAIQAGDGQILLSAHVNQLIQAMAGFTQQSGLTWDQAIDQQPQQVQAVLAASWQ